MRDESYMIKDSDTVAVGIEELGGNGHEETREL
jgi:hypothetical protein